MSKYLLAALLLLGHAQTTVLGRTKIVGPVTIPQATAPSCAGISCWPMNEGSGLTLNDISGNSNTATLSGSGAVTWTANSILTGVTSPVWQGTGNAIAASSTVTNFTGTTPMSVGAWVVLTTSGTEESLIGSLDATAGTSQGWELQRNSGNGFAFYMINTYPTNALGVDTNNAFSTGTLYYVVATYDGSQAASGINIYVNAVVQPFSIDKNNLVSTAANGHPAQFGGRNNGSAEYTGAMAYVEVYNSVLSSTQVSTNYAAGPGVY